MRNRYAGRCTHCGGSVEAAAGYFERRDHRWHVRCGKCVRERRADYGVSSARSIAAAGKAEDGDG